MKWYRLAAEQGLAEAQNKLGALYGDGKGVPQDYTEAAKWYRLAAEQGLAEPRTISVTCTVTAKAYRRTGPKR